MYLLIIMLMTLFIPFIIMPNYISRADKSPYEIVVKSVMFICAAAAIAFMTAGMTGDGVFTQLYKSVEEFAKAAAQDANVIKSLHLEETAEAERAGMVVKLYGEALKMLPACIFMMGTIISYIAYIILSRSLNKRSPVNLMPRFREFTFPNSAVMALVIVYMFVWIMTTEGTFSDNSFYLNIDVLFDFVFFIQGASVIFMLCYVKRIPKAAAFIFSLAMWYIFVGRTAVVMLGMFDLIFGFKLKMLKSNPRG